jgi:hypothetical protein
MKSLAYTVERSLKYLIGVTNVMAVATAGFEVLPHVLRTGSIPPITSSVSSQRSKGYIIVITTVSYLVPVVRLKSSTPISRVSEPRHVPRSPFLTDLFAHPDLQILHYVARALLFEPYEAC